MKLALMAAANHNTEADISQFTVCFDVQYEFHAKP